MRKKNRFAFGAIAIMLIIGLFKFSNLNAQCIAKTIKLTDESGFSEEIPFDQLFELKLSGKGHDKIIKAFLYYYNETPAAGSSKLGDPVQTIAYSLGNLYREAGATHLIFEPVEADKEINIALVYEPHGKILENLIELHKPLYKNDVEEAQTAFSEIEQISTDWALRQTFFSESFESHSEFFRDCLRQHYVGSDDLSFDWESLSNKSVNYSEIQLKYKLYDISLNEVILIKNAIDNTISKEIENGYLHLEGLYLSKVHLTELSKRLKNLNDSRSAINRATRNVDVALFREPANPTFLAFRGALVALDKELSLKINDLKLRQKQIQRKIVNRKELTYQKFFFGETQFTDLKTEGSYKLIPTLGIATFPVFDNNLIFTRPYIGASIFFKAINKNIPKDCLTDDNWNFERRFSINVAITAGAIDKEEYSDLYNNLSLMVGGNYKPFKGLRALEFSTGIIMLKGEHKNPIIDEKKLAVRPYVAISFDVDFINSINKLTGKFF